MNQLLIAREETLLVNSSVCRGLHRACSGGRALAGPVKTSYKLLCTMHSLGNIIFPKPRSDQITLKPPRCIPDNMSVINRFLQLLSSGFPLE